MHQYTFVCWLLTSQWLSNYTFQHHILPFKLVISTLTNNQADFVPATHHFITVVMCLFVTDWIKLEECLSKNEVY